MRERLNTEKFIKRAQSHPRHKGKDYDYSKVNFINSWTKVEIICQTHGSFITNPHNHISLGSGCPVCANNIKFTTEKFIEKAKMVRKHYDKNYDYSKVNYINSTTKIEIICTLHGSFFQRPNDHLHGIGCKKCGEIKRNKSITSDTEKFVLKASNITEHKNKKYDYSKAKYINSRTKVEIICPKHGSFFQNPIDHLTGRGCNRCVSSKGENEILFLLQSNNIKVKPQKDFDGLYSLSKRRLRYDFYLIEKKILIEYDGGQHESLKMFRSLMRRYNKKMSYGKCKRKYETLKRNDHLKTEYAAKNNIKLIRIKHDENIHQRLIEENIIPN